MLPPLPSTTLDLVDERPAAPGEDRAFIRVRHVVLKAHFPDGSTSEPFQYDIAHRDRLDAVIIAAHYRDAAGRRHVYLRSAARPPVALRPREAWPVPERPELGSLWELPAGLVEVEERSAAGLRTCAARELEEEVGFRVSPDALQSLGPSAFPSPGLIGERHFFFHVEVDPQARGTPSEDGSVLERNAVIVAIPLDAALDLARRGALEDAKTELALRRLAELP
jgi:ADP-ribose pyrophosphatase